MTNERSARGLDDAECDLMVDLELPTDAVHNAHRAGKMRRCGSFSYSVCRYFLL